LVKATARVFISFQLKGIRALVILK